MPYGAGLRPPQWGVDPIDLNSLRGAVDYTTEGPWRATRQQRQRQTRREAGAQNEGSVYGWSVDRQPGYRKD